MADYLEHSERRRNHRQPRDRRVDHTSPGFVRPPDPACFYCRRGMHDACISGDTPCPCCDTEETP